MSREPINWYQDPENVDLLCGWLEDQGMPRSEVTWARMFPHAFDDDWWAMQRERQANHV
jgi:hypothetical protein